MTEPMDRVIELARQLGDAIAETDRFKAFAAAQKAVSADASLREIDAKLRAQQEKIDKLLEEGKAVEPEDKRELENLQNTLRTSDALQDLARAEANYAEMMSRVSRAINEPLNRELGDEAGGD
jgi:cell fate (sporulation/competence/biofilm development) regulator YlbF (YheA/YmcA/DUF963 family)